MLSQHFKVNLLNLLTCYIFCFILFIIWNIRNIRMLSDKKTFQILCGNLFIISIFLCITMNFSSKGLV